jgi:TetR/AcrR family transcriptional regulator
MICIVQDELLYLIESYGKTIYMAEQAAEEKGRCSGKERLIQAAQKLIQERSLNEITIDDVIKTAEMSRPAFYYHFAGGKEELRSALVQRGLLEDTPVTDVREAILEAALRVFARAGTSAATLEDIAAESGVTRGTLTWHFHSKEDLLRGILKQFGPHFSMQPVNEMIDQELESGQHIDERELFCLLAGAFYDGYTQQGNITRLAVLVSHTHPDAARLLANKIVAGRKHIVEFIQKRQREGYFCKQIDANLFVQMLAMGFSMRAISGELNDFLPFGHFSREELIEQVVSLLLYGMIERHHAEQLLAQSS